MELWALTDHDEIGGQQRAAAAARAHGMRYLTGTEISVTFAGEDRAHRRPGLRPDDPQMKRGLEETRGGRGSRAHDIAAGLAQAGIPDAYEGALKYVGNPELISRTHFARYLVEVGVQGHQRGVPPLPHRGKPGYVPHRWASLKHAVQWITDAGGSPSSPTPRATS